MKGEEMGAKGDCIIHVESHRGCRPYNKQILGQFIEHFDRQIYGGIYEPGSPLSDEMGFRKDVLDAVRELRVPIVRWPGGCFVSAYHWRDGIGAGRKPTYDKAWLVEDPNTFGTDEFIAWCRKAGAEPYICTNAGTGTPEEMSDWVEYCNGQSGQWARLRTQNGSAEPFAVRYWSIGNENYGDWEMGAKTVEQWGPFVAESAKLMLHTDPGVKLAAAATAHIDWTLPLLAHAGRYLTYVSIHKYWDPLWVSNEPSPYRECMMASADPDSVIDLTGSIIRAAGFEGRLRIAFDEWNLRGWHHPPANGVHGADVAARVKNDLNCTYTMADAVFSACFLNACLRHSDLVQMACMAPLVNARGPIYAHPGGMVRRTTFHVLWMYANLLESNVVSTFVDGHSMRFEGASRMRIASEVPVLDAIATCDNEMHRWRVSLVNRHPEDSLRCRLRLGSSEASDFVWATVLDGDSPDAFNDVDAPERVIPERRKLPVSNGTVVLPAHSVAVLEMQV